METPALRLRGDDVRQASRDFVFQNAGTYPKVASYLLSNRRACVGSTAVGCSQIRHEAVPSLCESVELRKLSRLTDSPTAARILAVI